MINHPPSERHPELRVFLDHLSDLLPRVWDELEASQELEDEVVQQLIELRYAFGDRLVQLVTNLESGDYDQVLDDHGLLAGPERDFKLAGYRRAAESFEAWSGASPESAEEPNGQENDDEPLSESGDDEDAKPNRFRRWLSRVKKPLGWANVILKSLTVIPGGGAAEEIKDATERVVDDLAG